jgi:hypothetical protein
MSKRTPAERFFEKVDASGDCWEWTASLDDHGYGRFSLGRGKVTKAHKALWEMLHGPVPDGLELDHLCRNPKCVRPDHVEPVTHRENVMRGLVHRRFCVKGHDTYRVGRSSSRRCRECLREYDRQRGSRRG